jgi:hypothetical protein
MLSHLNRQDELLWHLQIASFFLTLVVRNIKNELQKVHNLFVYGNLWDLPFCFKTQVNMPFVYLSNFNILLRLILFHKDLIAIQIGPFYRKDVLEQNSFFVVQINWHLGT